MRILLASTSPTRRALLSAVGLAHEAIAPALAEGEVRDALLRTGTPLADLAIELAAAKALSVAAACGDGLVIGADQVAIVGGRLLTKPGTREGVIATLECLSGRMHELFAGVAVAQDGAIVWRHTSRAALHMRPLDREDITRYADAAGDTIYGSVGAYQIEGRGLALMDRVEGDHTTILGLPMLPLLSELRRRGVRIP